MNSTRALVRTRAHRRSAVSAGNAISIASARHARSPRERPDERVVGRSRPDSSATSVEKAIASTPNSSIVHWTTGAEEVAMQIERAVGILSKLRDGEDPRTGRALPAGSPCHDVDVVRALYTVLARVEDGSDCEAGAPVAPPSPPRPSRSRAGKPWTDPEDECLAAGFDEGRTVTDLGRALERSESAIRLRLVKLGRLSAEDVMTGRRRREVRAAPEPAAAAAS